MKIETTKYLDFHQKSHIFDLWNNEYPQQLSYESIENLEIYLNGISNPTHYFLSNQLDETVGWASTFSREGEIWFAIIINSEFHGKGYGKMLLDEMKIVENKLNGWVIDRDNEVKSNGELYRSPLDFYKKNDFKILSDIRLELELFSAVKIVWEKDHL